MILDNLEFLDQNWSKSPTSIKNLDSSNTLITVFADNQIPDIKSKLIELKSAFPNSIIVGGSTSGEILGNEVKDESIAVSIAKFEKSPIAYSSAMVSDFKNSTDIASKLAQDLIAQGKELKQELKGILILSDGLSVNGTELVNGFSNSTSNVMITGGLMGDAARFEKTFVLTDCDWEEAKVVAVGFYGDAIQLSHGSKGGWDVFGPERTVTKSEGNVLYKLDGKPALELYKTYLGELAADLPGSALLFPLAIVGQGETQLVRTILQVDEKNQSLTFAGDIPQDSQVQLMKANFDRLIDGAYSAAELTEWQDLSADQPTLCIAISCVGRRLVLKGRVEEEVEATLDALPKGTQQIGFYSYGEISPLSNGTCSLHNQTMTLTTIREEC